MKVLVTRSHEGNAELIPKLKALGIETVSLDLLEFFPPEDWAQVDDSLSRLQSYDWILFTSPTGVRFFVRRMGFLGRALVWDGPPRVGAVGERTAAALRRQGVRVDFTPPRFLTVELAKELPGPQGRVLLLRADVADREIADILKDRGFAAEDLTIYRTKRKSIGDTAPLLTVDLVVLGSPSAVESLCAQLSPEDLLKIISKPAACIGPVTAEAARKRGFLHVVQPESQTFDALVGSIGRMARVA
ncbi:MAG TPA: uroporphyrinogen-III synthase [Nitrososphaerales archaeon]|nr:uroporphyrinogen-III synthase [Nitrososphaerales archaeon]